MALGVLCLLCIDTEAKASFWSVVCGVRSGETLVQRCTEDRTHSRRYRCSSSLLARCVTANALIPLVLVDAVLGWSLLLRVYCVDSLVMSGAAVAIEKEAAPPQPY